ncbi:ubiquitin-conjugating enzyme E2 S isoform X1 [Quillaja saponaria]|uniref:Ubiquitin-conjugating enzyme E2 S isoform X1 n=1 Tax=Quillaja saponaria TaxID=32244 RepID=A0AAD7L002_QUISA|nr:ubiquitin-conjugating enzyme E2 S isoform X1 [Quillaja saponaria]
MGSECNPIKRHYDVTMSKRTRKPPHLNDPFEKLTPLSDPTKNVPLGNLLDEEVDENDHHKSLKQLINGDEEQKVDVGEGSKGRNSLGQHFNEEEKHLQLVSKQQEENLQGIKLKKLMRRYAKVLSHLIKIKRDKHNIGESRKKRVLQLTM